MRSTTNRLSLRLLILATFLTLAAARTVMAQETPKIEIAGLYTAIPEFFGPTCHGAAGQVAYNLTRWAGVVGEVSGCKGEDSGGGGFFSSAGENKWFTYLAGPRVSYRRLFTPYAHVLVGGAHLSIENSVRSVSDTGFALAIGFGVDVKVSQRVSIRLIQPEYLRTDFGGGSREDLRIQMGVVFALKK